MGSEGGDSRTGLVAARGQLGQQVPPRVTPEELRPLLSLPFPFIPCVCTYTV